MRKSGGLRVALRKQSACGKVADALILKRGERSGGYFARMERRERRDLTLQSSLVRLAK